MEQQSRNINILPLPMGRAVTGLVFSSSHSPSTDTTYLSSLKSYEDEYFSLVTMGSNNIDICFLYSWWSDILLFSYAFHRFGIVILKGCLWLSGAPLVSLSFPHGLFLVSAIVDHGKHHPGAYEQGDFVQGKCVVCLVKFVEGRRTVALPCLFSFFVKDYKNYSLNIDSVPIKSGKESPPLKLGSKGETVTFHIFVTAINHIPSTYVLSATRAKHGCIRTCSYTAKLRGVTNTLKFVETSGKTRGAGATVLIIIAIIVGALVVLLLGYAAFVYARTGRMIEFRDFNVSRRGDLFTPLVASEASRTGEHGFYPFLDIGYSVKSCIDRNYQIASDSWSLCMT
eukprot:Gb_41642 [translate_table: standard]